MENLNPIDPWAAPATKVAAFIGVFWVSYKILSFWRMIASLFILPGQSVCVQVKSMTLKSSTNV
jgi:17beta-estradiol 17-dehydrogenase / very-long-chain 3-oxoacyl-CoA reductase